jgi:hypothetical protein
MPRMHTNIARNGRVGAHLGGTDLSRLAASDDWRTTPLVSDDECLTLLAKAVKNHDPESLDEVAWLIGRLAVPIE